MENRNKIINIFLLIITICFVSETYAQCDFYRDIEISTNSFELSNTQEYVLVQDNSGAPGNILDVNSTGVFGALTPDVYWAYAVNYEGVSPTQLAIGQPWSGVVTYDANASNCFEALSAFKGRSLTLCAPLTICESENMVVSTSNQTATASYSQTFALVNSSAAIISFNTTGIFTLSDYLQEGEFEIYAVNTNDATVVSEITDLGPWSDVSDLMSGLKCLDILTPARLTVIDEDLAPCPMLLPVEYLSFYGEKVDLANRIRWTTATEINSDYFDLTSSIDGIVFEKIATIDAFGNSNSIQNYQFLDKEPKGLTTYYRLKQFDSDGNFAFSNIISLSREQKEKTILIYPNPTDANLNIEISSMDDELLIIEVYDVIGKLVYTKTVNSLVGMNKFKLNFENLALGNYNLVLSSEGAISYHRFILN